MLEVKMGTQYIVSDLVKEKADFEMLMLTTPNDLLPEERKVLGPLPETADSYGLLSRLSYLPGYPTWQDCGQNRHSHERDR